VTKQGATIVIDDGEDETTGAPAAAGGTVVIEDGSEDKTVKLPARAVRNDDGSVTLTLSAPVSLTVKTGRGSSEEVYSDLTFHEMTGRDLRHIAQAKAEMQTIVALACATKISVARMNGLFDQLKAKDVTAAAAVISFLQE
jgi:hypothetical protein